MINNFKLLDKNNDGFLTKKEISDGFKKLGKIYT